MKAFYKVQMSYPSGRVEVIEQDFEKGSDALDYGNNMLVQIANTEQFHTGNDEDAKKEPFFFIIEVKKGKQSVVYDSRQ